MKKIGVITFHSSHNYGSILQAYALQVFVKRLCSGDCDYRIINLRKSVQNEMYKTCFEKKNLKNRIKSLVFYAKKKELAAKQFLFENFINQKLDITEEFATIEDIMNANLKYDYYISGSDQLWNIYCRDFDWANYLEFAHDNAKRISYSASFGSNKQKWSEKEKERIKTNLLKYDCISVRELGSYETVNELTKIEPEINVDPTMLLTKEEWIQIIPKEKFLEKEYILFYTVNSEKIMINMVKKISKIMKLPVVITLDYGKAEWFSGFESHFDVGPFEFLNLVNNAKLVLTSSFHGTIFSIIFNTAFFSIRGNRDNRISALLTKMNFQNRSIDINDFEEKCAQAYNIDFSKVSGIIEQEKEKSKKYLRKVLDLEK